MTPSEELFLEVLAARWRTGERLWTFSSQQKRTANRLADRGLINLMHGIVEKTFRASLTEAGKKESLDDAYVPPFKRDIKKKRSGLW